VQKCSENFRGKKCGIYPYLLGISAYLFLEKRKSSKYCVSVQYSSVSVQYSSVSVQCSSVSVQYSSGALQKFIDLELKKYSLLIS